MNKYQFLALLKACFFIACIIFFTALCSEFSVRMFYSSANWSDQVIAGLIAILIITSLILLLLLMVSQLRRAFLRMFGEE